MAKILVVASDLRLRLYLGDLLLANFGNIQFVQSGRDADHLLNAERFDVVICDFYLDDMTGVEFREMMTKKTNKPYFILLTAHSVDPRIQSRLAIDQFVVLQKPPHPDELVLQIRRWFKTKKSA